MQPHTVLQTRATSQRAQEHLRKTSGKLPDTDDSKNGTRKRTSVSARTALPTICSLNLIRRYIPLQSMPRAASAILCFGASRGSCLPALFISFHLRFPKALSILKPLSRRDSVIITEGALKLAESDFTEPDGETHRMLPLILLNKEVKQLQNTGFRFKGDVRE